MCSIRVSSKMQYLCEETATVMALEYGQAFEGLTEREKMYTYYLFKAIAAGWRVFNVNLLNSQITSIQVSKEAPYILSLILRVFREEKGEELKERLLKEEGVYFYCLCNLQIDEKSVDAFLIYCYNVLGNMGNYRQFPYFFFMNSGFGDTKILPRCDIAEVERIIKHSLAYQKDSAKIEYLWSQCGEKIFSHMPNELRLGVGESGCSSYYNELISMEDIKLVQKYSLCLFFMQLLR